MVETTIGEEMLNRFLRNNTIVNLSTKVSENGLVVAIVVYTIDLYNENTNKQSVAKSDDIEILNFD
jgi:hypothetical protein